MNWIIAHLATVQLDVVTGIALITLLFMREYNKNT
jgi:hypothetical protein